MYIISTKRPKIIFFLSKIIPLDQKIIFIFLQKYGPKTGHKVKFFLKKLLSAVRNKNKIKKSKKESFFAFFCLFSNQLIDCFKQDMIYLT